MRGIRYIVMLVCSDVRYAHMCSSGTRAQFEVKRVHEMKKVDKAWHSEPNCICLNQDFQDFQIFRIIHIKGFRRGAGAVGNADRIWVSTPQNRTYRVWGL